MLHTLADIPSAVETGNNIFGIVIGLITVAGILVGLGKNIAATRANTKALEKQTDFYEHLNQKTSDHAAHIAVLRTDVETLKASDRDQWAKINRVAESGIHEAIVRKNSK